MTYNPVLFEALLSSPPGRAATGLPIWYFHAELSGAEHIPPTGGALLVGNHAMFGHDGIVLWALVRRETGRHVRFLGERLLFRVPVVGAALLAAGAVPGEPETAVSFLRDGSLVGVYPGGIVDSFKASTEKYRLQWGTRAGFARVAMRAGVPIVPIAAHGIDDAYRLLAREPVVGRRLFGGPRYDLPIVAGALGTLLPKRVTERFVALPAVDTAGDPERPEDVERVRSATFGALDAELEKSRRQVSRDT